MNKNQKSKKFEPIKKVLKQLFIESAPKLSVTLFIFILATCHSYRYHKALKERGVVTAATILQDGKEYVRLQYKANGKVYTKTQKKWYRYEFKIGGKYKLIYDPLDPEKYDLCSDENKHQYIPIEDSGKQSEKVNNK